jgi:hypothetical protein
LVFEEGSAWVLDGVVFFVDFKVVDPEICSLLELGFFRWAADFAGWVLSVKL